MMMVSVSFALPPTYLSYNGSTYKLSSITIAESTVCKYTGYQQPEFSVIQDGGSFVRVTFWKFISTDKVYCKDVGYQDKYLQAQGLYNKETTPTCLSPNTIVNGECVAPAIPTCVTGSHYDTTLKICSSDCKFHSKFPAVSQTCFHFFNSESGCKIVA